MDPAQQSFIRAMVQKQAADLKAHPDNPAGWARLVRSYGVLGDKAAQAQALAQARALYAKRPDLLAPIEGEARPRSGE
jgi:cytochrome c-type biogenesis protein CcmH